MKIDFVVFENKKKKSGNSPDYQINVRNPEGSQYPFKQIGGMWIKTGNTGNTFFSGSIETDKIEPKQETKTEGVPF